MEASGVALLGAYGLAGYAFGSIPFGLILTKIAGAGDIRSVGSGNIGATNVLRTGRKGLAAATLLCDALKGFLPVWLFSQGEFTLAAALGLGAFLGHLFPIWLGFKGGKGIATFIGILLAFGWQAFLVFAAIWLLVAFLSRYSSLAALIATAVTPMAFVVLGRLDAGAFFLLLSAIAWAKHHENIGRLLRGTESRIGGGSTPEPQ
ncbi:MAG: glycerol-3-phosphate 1-O-acyltransferase PlsY [Pseudomonadota bacterium]